MADAGFLEYEPGNYVSVIKADDEAPTFKQTELLEFLPKRMMERSSRVMAILHNGESCWIGNFLFVSYTGVGKEIGIQVSICGAGDTPDAALREAAAIAERSVDIDIPGWAKEVRG